MGERINRDTVRILEKIGNFKKEVPFQTGTLRGDKSFVVQITSVSNIRAVLESANCIRNVERPQHKKQGNVYVRLYDAQADGVCADCRYKSFCPILHPPV